MSASIGRALPRALALLAGLGLALSASPAAHAGKPIKPGTPTDLALGAVSMSGGSYVVPATWKAGANTTSFIGTVTGGGATLATAPLTGTSWAPSVAANAGTTITVSIVGVYGKFKSPAASASVTLPDVSAPVATYTATLPSATGSTVTFTRTSLTDDVSDPASIQVTVDYGDPSDSTVLHTTGAQESFQHTYPSTATAQRYQPTISVADASGNKAFAAVNAVVIADTEAPSGTARADVTSAWTGWTTVKVTTTATDNVSPPSFVKRTIAWGDGATTVTTGDTATHVYAAAGTFQPKVTFADEALPQANESTTAVVAGTVVVKNDVLRPSAALSLPRSKQRSVRSWKVLRGTSADHETAVRSVRVKVVEKRGHAYYAYVPATHAWVKAGRKGRALAKAGYLQVATTNAWSVAVPKLTTGVLLYRAEAVDAMGNVSPAVQHTQRLTKR